MSREAAKPVFQPAVLTEEDVCRRVRDSVLEQRLAPGTRLTEDKLCTVFGVNRTVVRRAFLLLSRDKIVHLEKNKGAVVATPTPEEADEVFEARRVVESALITQAATRATPADFEGLRTHLKTEKAALAEADIARWIRLTGEFHILLARLGGNAPMLAFLEQLVFQTSLIIALYGKAGAPSNCRGDDHERLVTALEQGRPEDAIRLLTDHLNSIEAGLDFVPRDDTQDLHQIFAASAG
ncbi:GntR family transcriptional regulator [Kordiimonas marina]|uniref:GntR family transcriptional regulator n=1 Tax=Kordiimonas marina TaxID=2872312 RepID=UPI001FF19D63|nr:GntR family transcriptional regulator [Kordiimonas marina]MCJ9430590.1 GntR family transcriptional regulator [Kordiimonas marina]